MDATQVLAKTSKGADEIKTRAHGLPQKLRTLLILIDGQKSVGMMLERMGGLGDVQASIDELVQNGFVEVVEGVVAENQSLTPRGAAAALAAARREEGYAEAVSALCRLLYEYLGPDADSFTAPLEKAATRDDFVTASERATQAVRGLAGAKKAERVAERSAFILARFLPA